MEQKKPTLEEIRAQLEALRIPVNQWKKTQAGSHPSPLLEQQKKALVQIRDFLQNQIQADHAKQAELLSLVERMKHGGGG